MKKKRNSRSGGILTALVTVCVLLVLIAGAMVCALWMGLFSDAAPSVRLPGSELIFPEATGQTGETEPAETAPTPEKVIATATVAATGDLLMHEPVFTSCRQEDGSYDFSGIFQYMEQYVREADLAVANLETTLAGTDNGYPYSGYPRFNCPDALVEDVRDAGFDLLLTVNNHSYDTTMVGYKRTLEVTRAAGLSTLGTMLTPEEPKYTVVDLGGIKVGMIAYTYATDNNGDGRPSLNGNNAIEEVGICNFFTYENLTGFYAEVEDRLEAMRRDGAEAIMFFIHWGVEYQTTQNEQQEAIAQALCDLGVDVIVGGHPHVVQPIELLTSETDPDHSTVCLYSLGNAVSNQRRDRMNLKTGHTEDGMLFSVSFCKYSDGTVYLQDVQVLPTWVYLDQSTEPYGYYILPLDDQCSDLWQELYELSDRYYSQALKSYDRTMTVVGSGLARVQTWLQEEALMRDWAYLYAVDPEAAGEPPVQNTEPLADAA